MEPSVGRIVHYLSYGTPGGEYKMECRAAVIAQVIDSQHVVLCVLNPSGIFFNTSSYSPVEEQKGGTWHWPERV